MRARLLKKRLAGKLLPVNLGEVVHMIRKGQFGQSEKAGLAQVAALAG